MRKHLTQWGFSVFTLLVLLASSVALTAAQGWVSLESRVNPLRSAGLTRLGLPISWGENSLIFVDVGAMATGAPTAQASIGIGFRRVQDADVIAGTYAFLDRGISSTGHSWDRLTLGYELISPSFDLHMNGYFADRAGKLIKTEHADAILVSGTDLLFEEADLNTYESALTGFDIELGRQVLASGSPTRAFVGAYAYHANTQPHIVGVRMGIEAQAELQWQTFPGATLTAKLEGQHDATRGTQGHVGFELRFPFGSGSESSDTSPSSPLLQPVRREMDIVTQVGQPQREVVQTTAALHPITREPIERVWVVSADGNGDGTFDAPADIEHAKANAGSHDLIVILGDSGPIDTGLNGFVMQRGQIVTGAGTPLIFLSSSGREADITFDGTPGRLTNSGPGQPILTLADYGSVIGLTFEGADGTAIYGHEVNGIVRVRGNTITDVGGAGVDITVGTDSSSPLHLLVEGNVITNVGADGIKVVSPVHASVGSLEISHNVIANTQDTGVFINVLHADLSSLHITHNSITNTGSTGIYAQADLGSRLEDVRIEENTIHATMDGGGIVLSLLRGSSANAFLARNVIENARLNGILINVDVSNLVATVEENVIFRPYSRGLVHYSYASVVHLDMRNNDIQDEWYRDYDE